MIPREILDEASRMSLQAGIRILQGFRLAETDETHVAELLEYMAPIHGSLWADIGCGFGEVAWQMNKQRPDLGFVLINNNQFQLDRAPSRYLRLLEDMHDIPLPGESVDGCMFLWSLCHADHFGAALSEAARITRPGGELFVFDFERTGGDDDDALLKQRLYARALSMTRMREITANTGWTMSDTINPRGDDAMFRRAYGDQAEYDLVFRDVLPVIWKAVRV